MNSSEKKISLTQSMFYILLALLDSDKHGYAIKKEIEFITDNELSLGPGSLYGSIQKLCEQRYISEVSDIDHKIDDNQTRRYYSITALGKSALNSELNKLKQAVLVAQQKENSLLL
jgi:DNA-binding PadR family transcriptional regulator